MEMRCFDDHDGEQTLDAVESIYLERQIADAEVFVLAAHFADLHDPATASETGHVLPGAERSVRLGGPGTPLVREFAAVEFGARMRLGKDAARHLIADALDVRHRLPRLWSRVLAGEVKVAWARLAANKSHHLSFDAAAVVDARVSEPADGRVPMARFETILAAAVVKADPETAARREADAALRQFARASRSHADGMRGFHVRASIAAIARIDSTVDYLARALAALGDTDDEDERRVKATVIMANPQHSVELLAAFAARRGTHADRHDEPPDDDPPDDEEPVDEQPPKERPGAAAAGSAKPFVYDPSRLLPQVRLYVHAYKDSLDSGEG